METPIEKLQRAIFSVDTEAGYRFRYHVTKARACEGYKRDINMGLFPKEDNAPRILYGCFIWDETKEGFAYWCNIYNLLLDSI